MSRTLNRFMKPFHTAFEYTIKIDKSRSTKPRKASQMRRSVGTLAVPECGCCRFCAERSAKKSR